MKARLWDYTTQGVTALTQLQLIQLIMFEASDTIVELKKQRISSLSTPTEVLSLSRLDLSALCGRVQTALD